MRLDKKLALSLYRCNALSFGKARQLAGLNKWEFQKELQQRKMLRHYSSKELEEDLAYARKELALLEFEIFYRVMVPQHSKERAEKSLQKLRQEK